MSEKSLNLLMQARHIEKRYLKKNVSEVLALKDINLSIYKNETLCIQGSSGAGKSTLLHILGTLDKADRGELLFGEKRLHLCSSKELSLFRKKELGFVFQFHYLLGEFTALENVLIAGQISGLSYQESESRAKDLLSYLGLSERLSHFPSELSGGEQQRVAIARALVHRPKILLADEPTGNLDTSNALQIMDLFFELKKSFDLTIVLVTHNYELSKLFSRCLYMQDGSLGNFVTE